jgi:hypothetical protein
MSFAFRYKKSCSAVEVNRLFVGTNRVLFHGRKLNQTRNQHEIVKNPCLSSNYELYRVIVSSPSQCFLTTDSIC